MQITQKAISIQGRYFCKEDITEIFLFSFSEYGLGENIVEIHTAEEKARFEVTDEEFCDVCMKLRECKYKISD